MKRKTRRERGLPGSAVEMEARVVSDPLPGESGNDGGAVHAAAHVRMSRQCCCGKGGTPL